MDYHLYIANKNYSSWSMRPWVLMQSLGIAFEEILVPFPTADHRQSFDAFSPTGKVPCLRDGSLLVWDSLAIVEYLAETHSGAWPTDKHARAWARSACAEMHSGFAALRDECSMNCSLIVDLGTPSSALQKDLARIVAIWEDGLQRFGGPWLAGHDFCAVDAFYAPVAIRCRGYRLPLSDLARDYAARLLSHPAVGRWIKEGIGEQWIDESHEEDCGRGRTILVDLRSYLSDRGDRPEG